VLDAPYNGPMARRSSLLALFCALLALGGCAGPESRLRTGLERAGLSKAMAACMAERMVDRLSLTQLIRIADLPRASGATSVGELMRRLRALEDPEVISVSARAAAHCALTASANDLRFVRSRINAVKTGFVAPAVL
jgi:hypothetical protein